MKFIVHKNNNYTILENKFLYDKNLTLAAKGLLSVLFTMGNRYTFEKTCLCCADDNGEIIQCLEELELSGYLTTVSEGKTVYYDVSNVSQAKVYA